MAIQLFKPTYRTIQNPVNLDILASTYNTLEKGHQQAVATSAAYAAKLAELDLNEAEDAWRQGEINKVRQALADNMVYGNAYAALDDVIKTYGDVSTNAGMLGRLRAQQDYKAYITNLEANDKISDDTKEMYRDLNKYYYEDKYDKNGNIVGGTKWSPIRREVDTIPLNNLIIKSIELAAKDKGTISNTRWLNAAGQPTSNPNEAVDGEVFNKTTQSWERLGEDKIMQMLQGLIETTPGAKASLQQDYEVAMYKRTKYGSNPDVEDKNGVPLSAEDYLMKRIKPSVAAASYNNVITNTTYGDGLKTYKAAQKAAAAKVGATSSIKNDFGYYSSTSTPITLSYDYTADLQTVKQNSTNSLKNIYKTLSGKDIDLDFDKATTEQINNAINTALNNSNLDEATKSKYILQTRKALRDLEESNYNYKQITDKIVDKDKIAQLDFISKINGGGEIDVKNTYGEKVIKLFNTLIGNNGEVIRYITDNEDVYNDIVNTLSGDTKGSIKDLGFTVGTDSAGNKYIDLNKNNYNQIVAYANAINGARPSMLSWQGLTTSENIVVLDKSGNPINREFSGSSGQVRHNFSNETLLNMISNIYTSAAKDVEKQLSIIAPQTITISNENLPFQTFTEQKLLHNYELGLLEEKEYNLIDKRLSSDLTNKLINHNYSQTDMYSVSDEEGYGTLDRRIESKDRIDIGKNIIAAIGSKRFKISAAHNAIHGNGSNITIYPTIDSEGNAKGTPSTYFIPGLIGEQAGLEFSNNSATKANDKITIGNEVGKRVMLSSNIDTPITGNQFIECLGNNQFVYNRDNQKYIVNKSEAVTITQYMDEYQDIKDSFISGDIFIGATDLSQINERISAAIELIANKIATAYGNPSDALYLKNTLINDLSK